jgi:hypothetical protein
MRPNRDLPLIRGGVFCMEETFCFRMSYFRVSSGGIGDGKTVKILSDNWVPLCPPGMLKPTSAKGGRNAPVTRRLLGLRSRSPRA